jgi:hypothetical protein
MYSFCTLAPLVQVLPGAAQILNLFCFIGLFFKSQKHVE